MLQDLTREAKDICKIIPAQMQISKNLLGRSPRLDGIASPMDLGHGKETLLLAKPVEPLYPRDFPRFQMNGPDCIRPLESALRGLDQSAITGLAQGVVYEQSELVDPVKLSDKVVGKRTAEAKANLVI